MIKRKLLFLSVAALLIFTALLISGHQVKAGVDMKLWDMLPSDDRASIPQELTKIEGAQNLGNQTCDECHPARDNDVDGLQWARNPHYRAKNAKNCEVCHGASSKHKDANDYTFQVAFRTDQTTNPNRLSIKDENRLCLSCHGKIKTLSMHGGAEVGCLDCHQIHRNDNPRLLKSRHEEDYCYSCHSNVQVENNMPSRHPVEEKHMTCSDCHRPHFTQGGKHLKERRSVDLCLSCHSDKQGPFAFPHMASEDCMACHTAHGSVNRRMLTVDQPFLCYQCHAVPFTHEGSWYATNYNCTTCHSQIHGSDQHYIFTR
ncbi:MAG: DmsE family decaheme c-type cytochrome [Armatimonadetes bacterium]|nr:DmsE family decaheme c-type cytochrome [Armatimonadota bacterium]